jgi:aspartate aminotransferase-like enzyme
MVRTVRVAMARSYLSVASSAWLLLVWDSAHHTREEKHMKKYQLMAPGPTPVPPNVLLAMARPIIHHRAAEYDALFLEVREGLKRLVQTQQDVVSPACTGTGAMEAAVTNTLCAGDRVIVVNAGAFAQRWLAICKAYGLSVVELEAPHGDTVSPDRIGQALREHKDVKAVLVQHSESSTGVLHDVRAYAQATRDTESILVVDAVSSLGIAELPMDAWGIDVVVSASQKGLMLPPGLGVLALSEKAWAAAKRSTLPKYYLDLTEERKYTAKNEARFTPAVSIMVGLREVLRMIDEEGLPNVLRRHDRLSRATRAGAEALGLTLFPKTTPSPALTAVQVPAGVDADRVVERFATSHNITIDGGRGPTKGKIFRIGHMGYVGDSDITSALAALEQVLHELGQPVDFGASLGAAQKVFAERG